LQQRGLADLGIDMNLLEKRKRRLTFKRSQSTFFVVVVVVVLALKKCFIVHGWGLYAAEDIERNGFVIEYVGEIIRQRIADLREER
jgi:histone-lysine N-methyltransferase SETD1